jgi:hypothetical protein
MSGPWYWCLIHNEVEPEQGCANDRRLGPYDSRDEAAHALEKAHDRTEAWDAEDDEWDED